MFSESKFINHESEGSGSEKREVLSAEIGEYTQNSLSEISRRTEQLEDVSSLQERLIALGKDSNYIQEISKKFFDSDSYNQIRDRARELENSILFHLGNAYYKYVKDIDQSIVAELKLRPIEKKFEKLKKKFKEDGLDLHYVDRADTQLYQHKDLVQEYIETNDFVSDIYTLQENIPKRKIENLSIDHFLAGADMGFVDPNSVYIRDQKALSLFYSFALHEIKNKKDVSIDRSVELVKAYLSPSSLIPILEDHTTKHLYHEKHIGDSPLRVTHPIYDRAKKLDEVMSQSNYILTDEMKEVLRESIVSLLEKSTYDFARHPREIDSLAGLIEKADFEPDQKEKIYDYLMEIPARLGHIDSVIELMAKGNLLSKPKYISKFFENFKHLGREGETRFNILYESCSQLSPYINEGHLEYIRKEYNRSVDYYLEKRSTTPKILEFLKKQEKFLEYKMIPESDFQDATRRLTEKLKSIFKEGFADKHLELLIAQRKSLQDVPEEYISAEEKELLIKEGVWSDSITAMINIYKPSRRTAYDVWHNEMAPLVNKKNQEGEISFENPQDGELVLDYVKKVGPINLPLYFTLFKNIKESSSVADMSQELKQELAENFNINVDVLCAGDPTNTDLIISEIEKYRHQVRTEFSNENVEFIKNVINTKYGEEFIMSIKGSSGFGQVDVKEVINDYLQSKNKSEYKFEIDPAYEQVNIEVGEYSADSENQDNSQEIKKVLSNSELKISYEKISETMNLTILESADALKNLSSAVSEEFDREIAGFEENINRQKTSETPNEKALQNMERMKDVILKMKKDFQNITPEDGSASIELLVQYFNSIPDKFNSKANLLRYLTITDFQKRFPEQFPNVRNIQPGEPTEDGVTEIASFLRDHIGEHYLNKKHGHGPESAIEIEDKNILRYLRKTWGVNDFDNNILSVSDKKINQLSKGELLGKKRNITMVPSKGLLRVFSGDLGGACTSNRAQELAIGKYEGITAYALVINKGQNNERFGGSFLVVEAETKDKQPMLVLRANNPSQSLVQTVDTDNLIKNIIGEVKNIAERKGISYVGVIRDNASQACSNRTEVSEYYKKNFAENMKVELKKTEDTTFNGYDIHNSKGNHPVVLI